MVDEVDVAVLIVMAYTGWHWETATAAVRQWRWLDPDWDAAYILGYLSSSERAWVERQKQGGGCGRNRANRVCHLRKCA